MARMIEITFAEDGTPTVEGKNFEGRSCEEASRFLEQALGRAESRDRKAEYFFRRTRTTANQQRIGQ